MQKHYMSFVLFLAILTSCTKRGRKQYLVPEPEKTTFVSSPMLKQIVSIKDGEIMTEELEALEKKAKKELGEVKKTSKQIQKEIKMRRQILRKSKTQRIEHLRTKYDRMIEQAHKDLKNKIKLVKTETQLKFDTLEAEKRKKEITLVDGAKQEVLAKVNQAEMDLLKKYIATKQKEALSPKEAQAVDEWKRESIQKLTENIDYLSGELEDDDEIQAVLDDREKMIESNITYTVKIGDSMHQRANAELASLTVMKEAYQESNKALSEKLSSIEVSDEDEEHIRLVVQADLPLVIEQAVASKEGISQDMIDKVVTNAIDRVTKPVLITTEDFQEKISNLTKELSKEKEEKTVNTEQLQKLQENLDILKSTLQSHIDKQEELKELIEQQKGELKISQLSENEKERKIRQLQEHLNRSTVSKFYAEIEATKIKNLQAQLQELRTSLDNSQENIEVAENKIKQLEEEKKKQKLLFKVKKEKLLKEKELLQSKNISLQKSWNKNAELRSRIEELNKKLQEETEKANRLRLIEKINAKTALLSKQRKDAAEQEEELKNNKETLEEEISDLKATSTMIQELTSQIKKQLAMG